MMQATIITIIVMIIFILTLIIFSFIFLSFIFWQSMAGLLASGCARQ